MQVRITIGYRRYLLDKPPADDPWSVFDVTTEDARFVIGTIHRETYECQAYKEGDEAFVRRFVDVVRALDGVNWDDAPKS